MRQSVLIIIFISLIGATVFQAIGAKWQWYSPFLMSLGVIILTALMQQSKRHDDF